MPAISHMRCKVCRQATVHKSSRFGMCPRHEREYLAYRSKERRAVKARRAERDAMNAQRKHEDGDAIVPASDEQPVPEASVSPQEAQAVPEKAWRVEARARVARIPDETKLEIAGHYENPRIRTTDIALAYGLTNAMVAMIARDLSVPDRPRGNKQSVAGYFNHVGGGKLVWQELKPNVSVAAAVAEALEVQQETPLPEAQVKALENLIRLPAAPEPLAKLTRTRQPPALTERWQIEAAGWVAVDGTSLEDVVAKFRERYPGLDMLQLRKEP